jgi:hypothetical protein
LVTLRCLVTGGEYGGAAGEPAEEHICFDGVDLLWIEAGITGFCSSPGGLAEG